MDTGIRRHLTFGRSSVFITKGSIRMGRYLRWSPEEFAYLLSHPELSAQVLSDLLPRRTVGAIEAARGGIDQYRNARPVAGLLSRMGIAMLEGQEPNIAV